MNQGTVTALSSRQPVTSSSDDDLERALIAAAKNGNKAAYQQLYGQYVGQVYALALRLSGDQSHAEDATQETFIQVWQSLTSFSGEAKFSTWLHRVTANVTVSHMRKQKNWLQRTFGLESANEADLVAPAQSEDNPLEQYIQRLPERARLVFVLHAVEGYRHEEVAQMTHMAVGSSKAQYHRAKQLLREWMSHESA
ncbi:RNA polymerase subunit sigma-24 [Neiella marina]|uniref:RNA polymerase subunit sigma-24 n=1 Tax=Neiella marina TaxID=508461 RepID=A0A8J2U3N2_9GAMM|nr:sigma-70 family RNA polymerase sigma factor [Neiella marina]GGA71031.1 RNA polymerase subunit sigma-24 [Neiella marina]